MGIIHGPPKTPNPLLRDKSGPIFTTSAYLASQGVVITNGSTLTRASKSYVGIKV